jgi:hypothetical protein
MDITTPAEKSKERKQIMKQLADAIAPKLLPSGGTQPKEKDNGYAFYDGNKKMKLNPLIFLLRNDKVADLSEEWYGMRLRINAEVVADAYIGKYWEGYFTFPGEREDFDTYYDARVHLLEKMYKAVEDEIKKISKKNSKSLDIVTDIAFGAIVLFIIDIDPRLDVYESLKKQRKPNPLEIIYVSLRP